MIIEAARNAIDLAEGLKRRKIEWFSYDGKELRFGFECFPAPTGPGIFYDKEQFFKSLVDEGIN